MLLNKQASSKFIWLRYPEKVTIIRKVNRTFKKVKMFEDECIEGVAVKVKISNKGIFLTVENGDHSFKRSATFLKVRYNGWHVFRTLQQRADTLRRQYERMNGIVRDEGRGGILGRYDRIHRRRTLAEEVELRRAFRYLDVEREEREEREEMEAMRQRIAMRGYL